MIVEGLLFLAGLAALVFGADRAVRSAAGLALRFGLSSFFVGVTVISIGTSVPEMTTSVISSFYGAGDLLVGNILGSEIAQITLAIGLVAMIRPLTAERRDVAVYGSAMMLAMIIMLLVLEDGVLIRSEGFLMCFSYLFFIYHLYTTEGGEEVAEEIEEPLSSALAIGGILVGLILVAGGGHVMVTYGVELARVLGAPELLIGQLAGLGTTVPEIVVASMAAWKGHGGISIGALLGSNITDPVLSLGIGGLVADVSLADPTAALLPGVYMIGVSFAVLAALWLDRGMRRPVAAVCLLLYLPSLIFL